MGRRVRVRAATCSLIHAAYQTGGAVPDPQYEARIGSAPALLRLTLIHLLSSRLLHLIVYFSLMKPYLTSRRSSSLTSPIPGAWYLYSFARSSMPEVSFTFMHPENVPAGVLHVSVRLSISARSIATLGASSW